MGAMASSAQIRADKVSHGIDVSLQQLNSDKLIQLERCKVYILSHR